MKLIKPMLIVWMFTGMTGCKQMMDKTEDISIKDQYKISVPGTLSKIDNLNENASLQYGNKLLEFYVIVIDEPIKEWTDAIQQYGAQIDSNITGDLKGYRSFLMKDFEKGVLNANFKASKEVTINNMAGHTYEVEGKVGAIDAYYYYTFLEGKEHYYQVLTWTLKDRKDKYRNYMETMTNSFTEL